MPSRPPLLSELKPTTSGIIRDPQTGDRKVAPSKRPDGTLRKEIKIRPGFTPSEDVSKFKSARQHDFESGKPPKGSVIGLIRSSETNAQAVLKGMSEAQRKNLKRKEKRKANAQTQKDEEEDPPEDWDRSSSCSSSKAKQQQEKALIKATPDPTSTITTTKSASKCSKPIAPGNSIFQSAIKSSSSNPQIHPTQQLVPPSTINDNHSSNLPVKRENTNKRSSSEVQNSGVKMFGNALHSIESSLNLNDKESVEKKVKAIRKKLAQAEQLKIRNNRGEPLLPEQLEKVHKIDELQTELSNLNL
ncbi:hypothetical protein BY996DRAFT_7132635 [Phakopsora pachyrhizi]|uniref:WIBG Mago-binding domain-containing protein n=1 Tax=Phakopsora pachyrhizi TaxID=170000 RepID=A0AAV0BAI7_PHAPC|nr:hypothetical protein BY996DRAFT_7132635 [Phakopsora pachyrhizi]CAH7684084.1 hypothetical protein PPACK8108_LOCUS18062 [Phakopsora pachyrhizi]